MVATVAVISIGENYFNEACVNRSWNNIALTDNALKMHDRSITTAASWLLITLCSAAVGIICNFMILVIVQCHQDSEEIP